jgi:hypothetical protein
MVVRDFDSWMLRLKALIDQYNRTHLESPASFEEVLKNLKQQGPMDEFGLMGIVTQTWLSFGCPWKVVRQIGALLRPFPGRRVTSEQVAEMSLDELLWRYDPTTDGPVKERIVSMVGDREVIAVRNGEVNIPATVAAVSAASNDPQWRHVRPFLHEGTTFTLLGVGKPVL